VEILTLDHGKDLWEAFSLDENGINWTYMPYGSFKDYSSFELWLISMINKPGTNYIDQF